MSTKTEAAKSTYHHGDLRRALIEAARRLVEEKGPDHFSVAEAARVAGVSKAAPYKHFADRDAMLLAVCMDSMDRKLVRMKDAIAPLPPDSPERIAALGRVYLSTAVEEPNIFRLVFGLAEQHENYEQAVEKGRQVLGHVQKTVAGVLKLDTVTPDVERRALMLWSFVHGLSFLMIDGKVSKMGLDAHLDTVVAEMAVRVLAPLPDGLADVAGEA